ncbi:MULTISPECIES: IclR family transcriptional regulator C-terminal domain-containing protein [unclassified Beijerinckia]|uniref:IclR family transcriptional regulator domain-containing protein n=1 Tax=unclassified Beijerinckia TaxID=2638183 RepID=UPI00089C1D9D|nr:MULTISPECIES: IclR family transcriptional regulator C-terminal domain-containing protein [unclassified Beijerinckia]MDH7798343.1 IclR family mhp operon transcriptional activator [Beijerinckia sp. GAS462]SED17789.1 transcriptional regulator, IclR family [Beijerinckia sp. 28-YEA-48]
MPVAQTRPTNRSRQSDKIADGHAEMRSVLRALTVLRQLNISNGATIRDLHRTTQISRTALYRILRTLCSAGYLVADSDVETYRLTPLVRQLSEGFNEDSWISEIAGPLLDELQKTVIWPTDLFAFFDDTMIMRRTTRRVSPWTIDRALVGLRTPLLVTACGRAYLAHQSEEVVAGVLERLSESRHPDDVLAKEPKAIRQLLRKVQRDGYALRAKSFMPETGSLAVPVLIDGQARCSIAITYIASAKSAQTVVDSYLPLLQATAAKIADGINKSSEI